LKKWTFLLMSLYLSGCNFPCTAQNIEVQPSPVDNSEQLTASDARSGIFPDSRLVVYYGNFYSPKMGILGQYPAPELWKKLKAEAQGWQAADPSKPVVTGLQYIVTVASNSPGKDKRYRNRMGDDQIHKALSMVRLEPGAVLILDVQPGLSDLSDEITRLDPFLTQPDVHLAVDPEFTMGDKSVPGRKIGTLNYQQINSVIDHLSQLVIEHKLPPKILVIHRFTKKMVTDFDRVKSDPNVQVVLDMDGWGTPQNKIATYKAVVSLEGGVLYPGIKLFYKNDTKYPPHRLLSKEEVLNLQPPPLYIQYQ